MKIKTDNVLVLTEDNCILHCFTKNDPDAKRVFESVAAQYGFQGEELSAGLKVGVLISDEVTIQLLESTG